MTKGKTIFLSEIKIIHSADQSHIQPITQALYLFEAENGKNMRSRYDDHLDDHAPVGEFAFEGDKLVGGITYHLKHSWVFLHCGYVYEQYRGRGFYQSLLRTLEDAAREKGFSGVFTSTFDFECPALYEKLGYTKGAVRRNCPKGNTSIDYSKSFAEGQNAKL